MRALAARLSIFIALLCWGAAAPAADKDAAYKRLDDFTQGLQSLQADFTQVLRDDRGRELDKSAGTLSVLRPGRFRWSYAKPHPQEIVSDGQRLWIFDKDLDQVTVRPLDESLAGTPAVLLSDSGSLKDSFEITDAQQKGTDWVLTLAPKRNDTDFRSVRLVFAGQALRSMELSDKLAHRSVLEFSNFRRNPQLDAALFKFTPPPGADVIGDSGEVKKK